MPAANSLNDRPLNMLLQKSKKKKIRKNEISGAVLKKPTEIQRVRKMRDGENKVEILKFGKPLVNHFHPLHIRDRDLNDETRNKPRLKRLWKRSICFDYGLCIQQMRSQVIVQLRLFFRLYCLLFGPSNRTET